MSEPGGGTVSEAGDATVSESGFTTIRTTGTVVIDIEACKGCDLCVDACPRDVLVMTTHEVNTRGYRYPQLLPGCIACKACTQICPDFVFQVYRYAEPVDLTVTADGVVSEVSR